MAVEVILPKVDMDMETGQISRWYAKDGDAVTKGQLLFEIETDKAAMEVDSPASGILGDVSALEGAVVPVGQAVAWIYAEGEERKGVSAPVEAVAAKTEIAPSTLVAKEEVASFQDAPPVTVEREGVRATPLARRLARDAGIDLSTLKGSGPKGRIQKTDIEASLAGAEPRAAAKAALANGEAPLNAVWLRQGDGASVPLVLIHGFGADLNSWRMMLAGASLANPVLALDLPGHGGSSLVIPEDLDAIAVLVEETLAAFGVAGCVLVGHSLGGAVAATIAARGVADIRSLVLISSAGLGPDINGAFLSGFVRAQSEQSLMPWLRQLVSDEAVLSRPFINATLAQAADRELRAAQASITDRFFTDGTQVFDVRGSLAPLSIPLRLIFGAEDRVIPVGHAHGLPGTVGVHIFPTCGHMPQIEQREAVVGIINEVARAVR
ncbi:MAG: acetoin dehydrogenase dihydrolipoyllysine-residue acetyltransferase subunit [Phyllobacterium sp.]